MEGPRIKVVNYLILYKGNSRFYMCITVGSKTLHNNDCYLSFLQRLEYIVINANMHFILKIICVAKYSITFMQIFKLHCSRQS